MQTTGGRVRVELRAVIEIPDDPDLAQAATWDTIAAVLNVTAPTEES